MNDPINPKYYTDMAISPLEYNVANNLDFVTGNIIKYVSRHKNKNGIEDLKKAKWYLDYLIKQEEAKNGNGKIAG